MKVETKVLLEEYKKEFKSYKEFLNDNHWIDDVSPNDKGVLYSEKLNTELSIVSTILKSMVKFKDDVGEDLSLKVIKDFINETVAIVKKHLSKIDAYKKNNPLNKESTSEDFNFQTKLFASKTSSKVSLTKLNIDEDEASKKSADLFYGNTKAPLIMREYLCKTHPEVLKKTEALGLDFTTSVINPATSNEMFINMKEKDIPKWDTSKHYFEQNISTIQFWEEEYRKICNGVNIYGYKISPFLYWHLNHYKLAYGAGADKGAKQPLFRDNEFFFDRMLTKAEINGRVGLLLYGSRRWSKSVSLSSKILHSLITIPKAQGTIQGYSEKPDLEAIINYIGDAVENLEPALKINANNMDLKEGAILGLKGKRAQDRFDFARLSVINLEGGNTKKGGQKTAGATPDVFVFDEIAKGDAITPWKAAIPSFAGGKNGRWRLTPLLAATAGNADLSRDAEAMLKNPDAYSIMPMDWDTLEEYIDPEYITWHRDKFGMFLPAQMSLEAPDKIEMPFAKFLGKENKADKLPNLNIHVTDWENANKFFNEQRDKLSSDLDMLSSYINSFPMQVEDCYMTSEVNKFPGLLAKKRKKYIEEYGLQGQAVWLIKYGGTIEAQHTKDPVIKDYPFKGGNFDAPVVILDDPYGDDKTPPPLGLYTIGIDDIKHDKSDGDSVISVTVFKRAYEGGEWANRIVAYYDTRPPRKVDAYKNIYLLIKYFNARVLFENEDEGFLNYMETYHMEDVYVHLSDGIGLATSENLNRNKNRRLGWAPTPINIHNLENGLVVYTKDENVIIGADEDLTGIERINHPLLLEEFYKYKKGQNADRIRSFGLALKLAQYYDKTHAYMKSRKKHFNEEETSFKKKKRTIGVKGFSFTNKLKKF